ncbi:hypothetical protein O7600_21010 [Micromonospora sp. WMMA1998]|uniref:hypothetical protein n=1 Tax=Micromonospora sp. WMMA1998 TaxID=3015167 RepID=UPI00248C9754|nr:hypothetical protein [Micromonospora sp. WMMA1998]WBC13600.1 hypothetical protein O7600_21010 [Micromonospora sp. WMMA1998]
MDALDRLAEPGLDLLTRVDTLLAAGAPEGHRLWPLLRRMQVLPGAAVREFLDLHPAPLTGAGHAVRRLVRGYDDTCALLTDHVAWSGSAAAAYDEARGALLRHLDEGPESLVGRLESTAGYADALAGWVESSRAALARVLAEALGSAEAVTVHAAGRPAGDAGRVGASAAAEIATRVLSVLGVAYDGAETLLRQWGPSLAETTWRDRAATAPRYGGTTRIGY